MYGKCCLTDGGRPAYSLIELLVVILIISIVSAILVPALGKAKRQAKRLLTKSRQKQIVQTINIYAFDNDDRLPQSVATIDDCAAD